MLWCRRNPQTRTPEAAFIITPRGWAPCTPPLDVRRGATVTDGGAMLVRESYRWKDPERLRSVKDGAPFWLCESDLEPRGMIPGEVEAIVAPWGIAIPEAVAAPWRAALRSVGPCNVMVAYHGTSVRYVPPILRLGVLENKAGMLGRGVYLTHFWRAAMRYAHMDQWYTIRPEGGAVVRVYVRGPRGTPPVFDVRDGSEGCSTCECGKCRCDKYSGLPRMRRVVDHDGLWRAKAVVGVYVPPCRGTTVDPKTGRTRWLARSDEWCCRGERCYDQELMRVDSEALGRNDYDAKVRKVKLK